MNAIDPKQKILDAVDERIDKLMAEMGGEDGAISHWVLHDLRRTM